MARAATLHPTLAADNLSAGLGFYFDRIVDERNAPPIIRLASQGDLPEFEMPEAEPDDDGPEPLVNSDMELLEHIEMLRERNRYADGDE